MMIGRDGDVQTLTQRALERVHVLVAGERRIGKTTVCRAVQARARDEHGMLVIYVEVPERSSSLDLCQLIVDRCLATEAKLTRLARLAKPLAERWLEDRGVPLDLAALGPEPVAARRRAVLELPRQMARRGTPVLLVFDELQRIVDYEDSAELLHDLADLYAGQHDVVLLVDGSHQRTFDGLLGDGDGLGKLVDRYELSPTIGVTEWRGSLTRRFDTAGHPIASEPLETLLEYGAGRPYPTMTAARHAALTARTTGGQTDAFCVDDGIAAAQRQLEDDGYGS